MHPPRHALAVAAVVGSLVLSGCTEVEEYESSYQPVSLQPVAGSDVRQVTLTAEAARRIDVETAPVRRRGPVTEIPYASLLYGDAGQTFTVVSESPLRYLRVPIRVRRISGDEVILAQGPAVGTAVVTVGLAEIYSAEFEVTED